MPPSLTAVPEPDAPSPRERELSGSECFIKEVWENERLSKEDKLKITTSLAQKGPKEEEEDEEVKKEKDLGFLAKNKALAAWVMGGLITLFNGGAVTGIIPTGSDDEVIQEISSLREEVVGSVEELQEQFLDLQIQQEQTAGALKSFIEYNGEVSDLPAGVQFYLASVHTEQLKQERKKEKRYENTTTSNNSNPSNASGNDGM